MTPDELENKLRHLGANWPMPSVAQAVLTRIESDPVPQARRSLFRRRRWILFGSAVALLIAAAVWLLFLATPRTLQAQVRRALDRSKTAHVVISSLDEKGVRRRADIWYERGRGFRAEAPDEVILDDGKHQWTWQPGSKESELVIVRRPSADAAAMITGMFQLADVPEAHLRAIEHDREFNGRSCRGYIVTPPPSMVVSADKPEPIPDPHPPRIVVLTDPEDRIVHLEVQRHVNGQWQSGREVSIAYDVKVPAEKLAVNLPAGGRVIDADKALSERFSLDRAWAKAEGGGLLFAVHELLRGEDDTFYVVSSVRGTAEHLKKYPPRRRRVNLQTTIIDVAQQTASSVDSECHRVALASAESDGVHYLWWLAARRRFFTIEQGKRTPRPNIRTPRPGIAAPALEVRSGQVRLPLQANYRDPRAGSNMVDVSVEVSLPDVKRTESLAKIAARVRRDGLLLQHGVGASLYGWVKKGELRHLSPDQITDAEYARQVNHQLQWLRSFDEITEGDGR